jgi:hypothetical protein
MRANLFVVFPLVWSYQMASSSVPARNVYHSYVFVRIKRNMLIDILRCAPQQRCVHTCRYQISMSAKEMYLSAFPPRDYKPLHQDRRSQQHLEEYKDPVLLRIL